VCHTITLERADDKRNDPLRLPYMGADLCRTLQRSLKDYSRKVLVQVGLQGVIIGNSIIAGLLHA